MQKALFCLKKLSVDLLCMFIKYKFSSNQLVWTFDIAENLDFDLWM